MTYKIVAQAWGKSERNRALEAAEIAEWGMRPRVQFCYLGEGKVQTWLGTTLGTITRSSVYRHNFGGKFVAVRVLGTNGAEYYGRASYDWGQCIRLRLLKTR